MTLERPVNTRARRMASISASVPEAHKAHHVHAGDDFGDLIGEAQFVFHASIPRPGRYP